MLKTTKYNIFLNSERKENETQQERLKQVSTEILINI